MLLTSAVTASAAPPPPKADGAATGPFYDLGTPGGFDGAWAVRTSRFGDEFDISVPAGASAATGPRWWMNWDDCGRGGSSITEVRFSMARAAAATSPLHAFRVTDTGGGIFATSENFRDGLAGAIDPARRPYVIGTSGCRAQLRLDQAITGGASDPIKRYWVTSPRAIVRDVQPPNVGLGPLPGGWQSIGTLDVNWGASDNFDESGVGNHHVLIDGTDRFVGYFRGVGALGRTIDLAGIPDGHHTVTALVDGDGTAGGSDSGDIYLDRTPPRAVIVPSALGPGHFRIDTDGADPAPGAGLMAWNVTLGDGTVLASTPTGAGPLADVDLSRFDGNDVVAHLTTRDGAGNEGRGSSAPMRVDVTAPAVAITSLGDWHNSAPIPIALDLGDNRADGIGSLTVSINQAADGSGSGDEVTVATVQHPARGSRTVPTPLPSGATDGVHRVTVTVRDPTFPQLVGVDHGVIKVDRVSPTLGDPNHWSLSQSDVSKFTLVLPEVRDEVSGVAAVRVLVNDNANGGTVQSGFHEIGTATPGPSAFSVAMDLANMAEGRHATLVQAVDQAGNVTQVSGPALVIDRTKPTVGINEFVNATGLIRWTQRDAGGFGACPTVVELQGVGTTDAWRSIVETPGREIAGGAGRAILPLRGLAAGSYQARVSVCDAAGNKASDTHRFTLVADPVGATTNATTNTSNGAGHVTNKGPNLVRARITAITVQRGVGKHLVSPPEGFVVGERATIAGKLVHEDGRAIDDVAVVLRDSAGIWRSGGRTAGDGTFSLATVLGRGGKWTVSAIGSPTVSRAFGVRVHAKLTSNLTSHSLSPKSGLVVTGRIDPGKLAANKLLQLQWRDGRQWRPIANVTADASGAFEVRYQFHRGGGYSVPVRLVVPGERGWPFQPIIGLPAIIRVK